MSKNDMVMELGFDVVDDSAAWNNRDRIGKSMFDCERHYGEPVAWVRFRNGEPDYDGDAVMISNTPGDTLGDGDSWEPVYTRADPGEVERLRGIIRMHEKTVREQTDHLAYMHAQLAERDALLSRVLDHLKSGKPGEAQVAIYNALSDSAEPSAPAAQCTNEDSWNCKYCRNTESCEALKDPRSFGKPSATVEIDERAEITLDQVLRAYEYAERHPHRYLRGTTNWCAAVAHSLNKQASATLERKP